MPIYPIKLGMGLHAQIVKQRHRKYPVLEKKSQQGDDSEIKFPKRLLLTDVSSKISLYINTAIY